MTPPSTAPQRPSIRLFVSQPLTGATLIPLSPAQSHYLSAVMRVAPGDTIVLFNGAHGEWQGTITEIAKKRVTLHLDTLLREQESDTSPDVWLLFAPIKKQRTDIIVEKATELGVHTLWPVLTQHTIATRVNTDRLRANAIEASEQCERLTIPKIASPSSLIAVLQQWPSDRPLYVLDETGEGNPVSTVLAKTSHGPAAFLSGPEGGFSHFELDLLRRAPFVTSVTLGPRILRAETAAIVSLACWQALCGDWNGRPAVRSPFSIQG